MPIGGTSDANVDHNYGSKLHNDTDIQRVVRVHMHKLPFEHSVKAAITGDQCNKVLEFPYSAYFVQHAEQRVVYEYPWLAWSRVKSAPVDAPLLDQFVFGALVSPTTVMSVQTEEDYVQWTIGEMYSTHLEHGDEDDSLVQVYGKHNKSGNNLSSLYSLDTAVLFSSPITILPENTQFSNHDKIRHCVVCVMQISETQFVVVRYFGDEFETVTCSSSIRVLPVALVHIDPLSGSQKIGKLLSKTPGLTHTPAPAAVPKVSKNFYTTQANDMQHKWVVALVNEHGAQFCCGVLVGARHVLTAKHCSLSSGKFTVRVGGLSLNKPEEFIIRDVARIIAHPQADVMIVELDKPIEGVKPIQVNADPYVPTPGTSVVVLGWGKTPDSVLARVNVPILSTQQCLHSDSRFDANLEICAGLLNIGEKDACAGDSGGPLVVTGQDGNVLAGITSHGKGCGLKGQAGVYVKAAAVASWIALHVPDVTTVPPLQPVVVENFTTFSDGHIVVMLVLLGGLVAYVIFQSGIS